MKLLIFLDVCFNHYKVKIILTTHIIECENLMYKLQHIYYMNLRMMNLNELCVKTKIITKFGATQKNINIALHPTLRPPSRFINPMIHPQAQNQS
jgi:hypothetical protein